MRQYLRLMIYVYIIPSLDYMSNCFDISCATLLKQRSTSPSCITELELKQIKTGIFSLPLTTRGKFMAHQHVNPFIFQVSVYFENREMAKLSVKSRNIYLDHSYLTAWSTFVRKRTLNNLWMIYLLPREEIVALSFL